MGTPTVVVGGEGGAEALSGSRRLSPALWVLACAGALLAVGGLVYWWLFRYGVSTVWGGDGFDQHFPALYYYNVLLREFLAHPSAGLPLWSWNLGLGADVIGALSWYASDPFALLSLLVPMAWLEYAYEALYFLRLLLAGLAAYAYLRKMKAAEFAAITGSLMYVFVTFALVAALRHPFFANPMVYLPLLLIGVEQVLARQRPYLLVAAVFLAAVSSFYFFFQLTIVVVAYAVARYVEITPRGQRVKGLAGVGLAVAGFYVLGMALAAFALVPAVVAFLDSSRAGVNAPLPLLHSFEEYRLFVSALWSASPGPDSGYAGFSILGFLLLPVLFVRRGKRTGLKAMLIMFPVFLAFPFFGALFNGFAFPSYRFLFMWGMFLAAGAALLLSERTALSGREILAMLAGLVAYTTLGLAAAGGPDHINLAPLGVGALMWACFAGEWALARRRAAASAASGPAARTTSPVARAAVCALVVVNLGLNGAASSDLAYSPKLKDYVPLGQVLQRYRDNPGSIAAALPADGFYRVDKQVLARGSNFGTLPSNDPLVQGYYGLDFYYSVLDRNLFQYLHGLALRSERSSFDYEGLDDRAALDTLAGVRYYLADAGATEYAPYGFTQVSVVGTTTVFRNRYELPLGYVYHAAVSERDYAAMSPLEKQQALLQGVVLDPGAAPGVPRIAVRSEVVDLPYSVTTTNGAVLDLKARRFTTTPNGGTAEFRISPVPDSELYVEMTGISFAAKAASATATVATSGGLLRRWARDLGISRKKKSQADLRLIFGTTGSPKARLISPPASIYYWGNDVALVNLGYFPAGTDRAYMKLQERAAVDYASLKVRAVPMGLFAQRVGRLAAEGMRDAQVSKMGVSGTVTAKGEGLLFLSMPYSTGWSATVDGVPAQVVKANVGFCGIPITGGTHTVRMTYVTPGLVSGIALSLLGLLALGGLVALGSPRRPRSPVPDSEASPAES